MIGVSTIGNNYTFQSILYMACVKRKLCWKVHLSYSGFIPDDGCYSYKSLMTFPRYYEKN